MVDSRKIGWGILGTGNIARQFCSGVRGCERGVLLAVGSRTAASAAEFAGQYAISKSYPTYEQVLSDKQVDAVYISLPNSMHCEWTIKALEAGKHVLCEKPISANEAEAKRMFEVADSAAKILVEAFMYRAHPQTKEMIQKIRSGAVGEVKLIRSSFCYRTSRMEGNIRWDPELSGGSLMDVGCYCINFSRMVAGAEVVEVQASGKLHESGVDEMVVGNLRFANGVLANFSCGMRAQGDNSAYVCGSEGYLE